MFDVVLKADMVAEGLEARTEENTEYCGRTGKGASAQD